MPVKKATKSKTVIGKNGKPKVPTKKGTKFTKTGQPIVRLTDVKRAAIFAAILEGDADTFIAEKLGVSDSTINRHRKLIPKEFLEKVAEKKQNKLGELVQENLEKSFEATMKLAELIQNEAWFITQKAGEIATLYGVITDKQLRILEAAERSAEREQEFARDQWEFEERQRKYKQINQETETTN